MNQNEEYEYSYKVKNLNKFLDYLNEKYQFIERVKEKRVIYRNNETIARITYKNDEMYLDFKENKISNNELTIRRESKAIKFDNLKNCEDILNFLNYKKDNTLIRYRSIYVGNNIKFEIDEYIEPEEINVISFEGDKKVCNKVNKEIEELLNE